MYNLSLHSQVRVHLWDLSGGSEYYDVRNELYIGTDAVFLVYDVTDQASFDCLDIWMKELKKYGAGKAVACLVGNKVKFLLLLTVILQDGKRLL